MNQLDVKRYLAMKDFYEILGVSKQATDDEIKRSYRKLALKFHPDKCKLEGAQDVFKKIAQAYDCLSNKDKRSFYDRTGQAEPQQYQQQYHQEDLNPQDIFDFFFNGGMHQGGPYRQQRRRQYANHQAQGQGINLFQLLPLILILFSGSIFSFFQEDPAYSFERSYNYSVKRSSVVLDINYYVNKDFAAKYSDREDLRKIEKEIEVAYIYNLRSTCNSHNQYKRNLQQQYRYTRNEAYNRKANSVDLSSCREFERLDRDYNLMMYD